MSAAQADLFRSAGELVKFGGLCKGRYTHETAVGVEFCTVGALKRAAGVTSTFATELQPELDTLAEVLGSPAAELPCSCGCGYVGEDAFGKVTRWNDRDVTTADDVVALFEQAAERAEATATVSA